MSQIAKLLSNLISASQTPQKRKNHALAGTLSSEALEPRQLLTVTNPYFSGSLLVVPTNNSATKIDLSATTTTVQVKDLSANKVWSYARSSVSKIELQGGNGNDRFVNNIQTMPVRMFGGAGDDYLEGFDGNDFLVGGAGNDTLTGYGGNDLIQGGDGNDTINGSAGNDQLWGGAGNDVLLGGSGNDELSGEGGNDQLNGHADLDKLWGGSGDDVLIAIDNGTSDYVQSDNGYDVIWIDRNGSGTDAMYGNSDIDRVQQVSSFANGADRTLNGDRIADPNGRIVDDEGKVHGSFRKSFEDVPLFRPSGPSVADVRQGACGDCYFLAGIGAIAQDSPRTIRQNIVDFNDGTYGVRLGDSFFRVDNDLPVDSKEQTSPSYAQLGQPAHQSMWVAIAEKAFAHFRTGANSYASIESGSAVEVNRIFGASSPTSRAFSWFSSAASMANEIYSRWINNEAVTVGFNGDKKKEASNTLPLILGHAYTVTNVIRNSVGTVTGIELRNPWGHDGGKVTSGDPNDGLVLLKPTQLWELRSIGHINWGRV